MSPNPDLPLWVALPVALLLLVGAAFTLIGSVGLVRLKTFYDRAHAPTIGSSAGVACISIASVIFFSVLQTRLALQEMLIFLLVTITMPVTLMLLARAALFRDRVEGSSAVPTRSGAPLAREDPEALDSRAERASGEEAGGPVPGEAGPS